jgi:hypothetical protein
MSDPTPQPEEGSNLPVPWVPSGEALVASAKKIDFTSDDDKKRYKKRQKGWQDEAWRYYDECGEAWFAANFIANCLRKVRIFAAVQPDVSQPPVAIADDAQGELGVAVAQVERLGRSDGGMGGIMAGFGLNLSVVGECVLVGQEDILGIERWKVHSTDEVFINSAGKWATRGSPTDKKGTPLEENSVAYRLWRPHPRWSEQADSPMRPLLDVIEELLILSRAIRASGRSRLAGAGMLLWPAEANLGGAANPNQQSVSGQVVDPVLADLMNAMLTPIGDEGVAAAVVPLLMKLPSQYIDKVRHVLFERPIDPQLAAQRMELIRRMANGLDIPSQVILGIEDVNHWTGWMIDEQTFKAHLEPLVIQICGSLTAEFLRPAIGAMDPDESDVLIWYDAAALIGHPNKAQDSKDAHDRFVLSDKGLAKNLGIPEEDMPDEAEIQARLAREALKRMGAMRAGEIVQTPPSGAEGVQPGPPAEIGQETGAQAGDQAAQDAQAASASLQVVRGASGRRSRVGWRLAHRDRELRLRLNEAANHAMFRALERAGSTLRRHSSRDSAIKTMIADVDNWAVAARLGPELVAKYGVDTQSILDESFDNLVMRVDREVQQAQQALRDMLSDMDENDDLDLDDLAAKQAESRREAEALLVVALGLLANQRLFDPHPAAPELGEFDSELLVPPGYLRETLAIAGGAPVPSELDGLLDGSSGGILTGDLAEEIWTGLGVGPAGYEWFTGSPDRPFDPHLDLEGAEFDSFDDEILIADASEFPYVGHYFPGDHWGCQCDFAPVLSS